jgi:hypothetical protein
LSELNFEDRIKAERKPERFWFWFFHKCFNSKLERIIILCTIKGILNLKRIFSC